MVEFERKLLEIIKEAAKEAGVLLKERCQQGSVIDFGRKGESDFVTLYDRVAERVIIESISKIFPGLAYIGEEGGITQGDDSEYSVIIDPLDGTNNFIHALPHFSVSIAVAKRDELLLGAVYHPILDEMLWAGKGLGAYLNDKPLKVPTARPLHDMLLSTCLPYHEKGDCSISLDQISNMMPQVAGIRSPGSAALEIAYTSLGRYDAFWSEGARLDLWDIAAAIVIAREAGCKVTDLTGNPDPEVWSSLLVAHPHRHNELLNWLS